MCSENLDSADNQQERLRTEEETGWFIAGFVEGEGSVCVCLKRHPTASFGIYVQPEFLIYQHRVRRELLEMAKEYFQVGRIDRKPGNPDVLVYSVKSRPALRQRIIPFLKRYDRFSARTADFRKFALVVDLLDAGVHATPEGLVAIVDIAYSMNMSGKQRRTPKAEIVRRILRGHTPGIPGQG